MKHLAGIPVELDPGLTRGSAVLRGPIVARRGRACLVCTTPTTSEGQLCDECVDKGHRVENDTLLVNLDVHVRTKPGIHWTLVQPIPEEDDRG